MSNHARTIDYHGMKLDVGFSYFPPRKGMRGDYGLQAEPDEPEYFEINEVYWVDKDDERFEIADMLNDETLNGLEQALRNRDE